MGVYTLSEASGPLPAALAAHPSHDLHTQACAACSTGLDSTIPNLLQAQSSSVASSLCPSCDRQGPARKELLLLGQPQVLALEVQGSEQVGRAVTVLWVWH